ncbi:MAG TPA: hypothetical protein VGH99_10255 [Pseudonocardia sp.]
MDRHGHRGGDRREHDQRGAPAQRGGQGTRAGTNTELANPPSTVTTSTARARPSANQRVVSANAGS